MDALLAEHAATVVCRAAASVGLQPTWLSRARVDLVARLGFLLLVCAGAQAPGQRVLGLRFSSNRLRIVAYCLAEAVATVALSARSQLYAAGLLSSAASRFVLALDALRALAACALLARGDYATVGELLTGLQTVRAAPDSAPSLRHASLPSVNTSLAFRMVSESAAFVRGFADWDALARAAAAALAGAAAAALEPTRWAAPAPGSDNPAASVTLPQPKPFSVPFPPASATCVRCGLERACMPQQADCGHAFCYVCIAGTLAGGDAAPAACCPACGRSVAAFRPLHAALHTAAAPPLQPLSRA